MVGNLGAQVTFKDVSVAIGGVPILESISATVMPGSATAIIGPNGAGKTTLILAMLGQIEFGGSIRITSPEPGAAIRLGYVPQRLEFDRGLPLTVMDYMVMGSQRRPLWLGKDSRQRQQAQELLGQVKAEHLTGRRLGALSGGELQRVQLALALTRDPHLLVLDEPAAGVDIRGGQLLCELLEKIQRKRGFTQLMVTHDLSLVTAHASHVICLNHQVTGAGPTTETLRPEVLAATFGLHLGLPSLGVLPSEAESSPQGRCGHHHHD